MTKELRTQLQKQLENNKAALRKELESFASEDTKLKDNWDTKYPNRDVEKNLEEEATETEEYENLLSVEYSLELKLKDVNAALEKIEKGTYGSCEKCSKDIEEERLKAYPEARLCMTCNTNK